MALGQQRDHQLLDHVLLTHDHPLNLRNRLAQKPRRLLVSEQCLPRRLTTRCPVDLGSRLTV